MAVDSGQDAGARGLSRRQMIKASAVAGAAAWTAPVVIDSLASPAAAYSGACQPYAVKLTPQGSVYSACFGGTSSICFPASDAKWAGTAPGTTSTSCGNSNPTFCPGSSGTAAGHLPSISLVSVGGTAYYKVVFSGACGFSPTTTWQLGGRYQPGNPGTQFKKIATTCSGGPSGGSDGCWDAATNTGWIRRYWSGSSGDELNYIYLKYCCPTGS